ncbi:LOW QUALITY PROTEIN: ATP-binding cassette sub-family A member 1-like [Lingula anatina]|uniref:LOW QUALITY PROTEIN: ATP-binding cassette sub-family A member 1-like n=1 Tax=Lingula anatina TaxID=7574 RepID=A0A1S3JVH4_LINAN|nr:LOW QUALITY PROTEIN: ATP-binding cassette sub-family A member 1-like [Lingula anatina]|eukprot:XP_013414368.2 LOW QUALITY PROTEIN: ATP-binding cassette sub-family A member 1-like [Lingula anatina]
MVSGTTSVLSAWEVGDYCNDELFAVFKTNQFTKALWQQLEPMVTGKILFTPDTPLTNKLMDRANMFFSDLGRIRNVAQDWLAYSPTLKNYLSTSSNIQLLRDILNTTSREQLARLPVLSIAVSQLNITDAMWEQWKNSSTRAYFLRYLDSSDYDANGLPRYNWKDSLNYTDVMMRAILKASQCFEFEKFEGHPNETEIIKRSHELIETNQFWAAIVIDNVDNETTVLPTHVNYRLRLNREKTDNTRQIMDKYWRPGPRASPFPDLKYLVFGFSYIQDLLESAIIEEHTSSEDRIGVFVQQFPYPCYIYDKFTMAISRSMPLFMVLAWIYTVAMVVKGVVHEKERRLKEVMKIMGLGNGIHWLAWFINSLVMMTITVILLVITLHFGRVLEHSDPIVLFVFLMAFTVATISQCFLFSVFFSKANLAAACGGFLYFVLYLPYTLIIQWEEYMSTGDKAASALLSTVAFGLGCGYFAKYEEQAVGIQWSNIASSPQPDDGFSMAFCIFMMLVDAVIYWILTWYIEAVFPGEYGIPRPWYFPVTRSYWCGFQQKETNTEEGFNGHVGRVTGNYTVSHNYEMQGRQEDSADIESEPTNLPLGVGLRNLRKVYRRGQKVAVDGLTLNFYEGQITSFLGHNGAGKTTTMSVLTGLFPPTEGTAVVYGKDIRTDMDTIRNSLGVCPQYNVLFDGLTVEEHMWFYARLKGMSEAEVKQEMEGMIKDVGLPHKRDELSKNLSGGMKRKLSVAIAFVGGSKTVILDEPTAGVDPYARRAIWDLLVKYRKGRTIILSTHHMDEADILGDRIAIISLGKLRCCGSSLFLKNKYGSGYYLTMVKANSDEKPADRPVTALSNRTVSDIKAQFVSEKDEGVADMSDTGSKSEHSDSDQSATPPPEYEDPVPCVKDSSDVAVFVQKFIPSAKLVEDMGTELCFQLPEEGTHTGAFEALFRALESNLTKLGITSYGISDTTLEEVFLKVAEESGVDDVNEEQTRNALERYTEGGKIARPVTRLSFRKKKLDFFKKSKPVLNISDTNELVDSDFEDADSVASMPVSEVSTAQGGAGSHKVTGLAHTKDQFLALFVKRFHHVRRSYKGFVCEILLPAIFVCIAMIFTKIIPVIKENPALELQPWMYVPITGTNPHLTVFYTNDAPGSMLADSLERQIRSPLGIGTRCMNSSVYSIRGYPCTPASSAERWTPSPAVTGNTSLDSPSCSCDTGYQTCPPGAGGPLGSSRVMDNTDRLVNMTGRNVSDWLVKTMEDYKKRRYGGYSLGERNQLVQLNSSQLYQVVDRLSRAVNNGQPVLNGNESIWSDIDALIKNVAVQNNVKVWFNNKGWAAMASYMNAMNNVILRSKLPPGKDPAQYGITVSNHPMAPTNKQIERDTLNSAWISVLVAIGVIFAMSFIPASFVLYLIEERVSNSKHLQFVSGVNRVTYWVSHLAWDIMNYSVSMVLCILLFLAFNERSYVSPTNAPCLVLLLFLYGWAMIPMMFPFNYLFKVPSTAFVALACVNVFLGVTSTLSTYVLEFFSDDQELVQINTVLRQVFLILPHYCLGRGLIDMAANQLIADVAGIYVAGTAVKDPFEWDQVGRNLFALAVSGAAWFGFTLLIEYKFFCTSRLSSNENAVDDNEDIDVARERRRAMSAEARSDILRVENLTKVFHKRRKGKFVAVDRLCFSVPKGECFGLLGVNGAGKTTTFKMLTGDETVTKGNAHLAGHSILSEMPSVHQNLGYCPQFDALDMLVTGREHLEFYARLRGVPSSEVKQVAQYCIKKLGLIRYADKPAGEYSGGNRRKLSTAIALIGNPPVIFLDEPTTGMDPKARRFLWNCITSILKDGRSVILTSHSMEECEALCGRIGIMVNGRFRCMGSVQHLKNRFGDGYTVILRVKGHSPDLQPVMNYIQHTFPNVMLKEKHHNMLQYQLPSQGLLLSYLFGKLESVRQELDIEDYSVNQTTLDQVFINFAKLQVDAQDVPEDAEDAMETCKEVNTAPSSMTEQFTVSGSACDLDLIHQSQLYSQVGDFYDDVSITGSTAELIRIDSRRSSMRSTMTPVEDV